jgi:hypothetical protein
MAFADIFEGFGFSLSWTVGCSLTDGGFLGSAFSQYGQKIDLLSISLLQNGQNIDQASNIAK